MNRGRSVAGKGRKRRYASCAIVCVQQSNPPDPDPQVLMASHIRAGFCSSAPSFCFRAARQKRGARIVIVVFFVFLPVLDFHFARVSVFGRVIRLVSATASSSLCQSTRAGSAPILFTCIFIFVIGGGIGPPTLLFPRSVIVSSSIVFNRRS